MTEFAEHLAQLGQNVDSIEVNVSAVRRLFSLLDIEQGDFSAASTLAAVCSNNELGELLAPCALWGD